MDEISIHQRIISAASRGELTFFIGNGISRLYGLPSWNTFANLILEELAEKEKINYAQCEQLKKRPLKEKISIAHTHAKDILELNYKKIIKSNMILKIQSKSINSF